MKNIFTALYIPTLTVLCAFAFADDVKTDEKMRMMKEYSTPGEYHTKLAAMAGNWKYTSVWKETADGKSEVSNGTTNMKMIMDGRFLQQDVKGKSMGQNFKGLGTIGYNNVKKQYESTWIDNMATGMAHGTGTFDKTKDTIVETGEFSCPTAAGGKTQTYRAEWKMIDKDKSTYTMWIKDDSGKEFINMEMNYTRSK